MVSVAALGFGDIPVPAFAAAFDRVVDGGWVAFDIEDRFLADVDETGCARFVRASMGTPCLDVHHLERSRHRVSRAGQPLRDFAVVGPERASLTDRTRKEHGLPLAVEAGGGSR